MTATSDPIAVLGAGSWGTALAIHLARRGRAVRLWAHRRDHARALAEAGENRRYLPGIAFPAGLAVDDDAAACVGGARDLLIAVPSHALRETLRRISDVLDPDQRVALACKGIEPQTGSLGHETVASELGPSVATAVISGPTFAAEVARGLPAGVTVAAADPAFALEMAAHLHDGRFRAYTTDDVVGVEVAGAVKNILAIATGVADGLGFGANTRAALITRGLAEISRLGMALGGQPETFQGLAGVGDLVLTCTDDQSRNRRFGLAVGAGKSVVAAEREIGQVVEGIRAAAAVRPIATRLGVTMPISEQVYQVINGTRTARQAVEMLTADGAPKPETR